MKKTTIAIVLAMLCLYTRCLAQPAHRFLTVGDTLPASLLFKNVVNSPSSEIPLSAFSNKLLLLDFWASWCTPCVKSLPKIDTLRQELGPAFSSLLISSYRNPETIATVEKFSERYQRNHGQANPFPIVLADSTVSMLLDVPSLPHYVWVWNRQIIAISKKPLSVCAVRQLLRSYTSTH